MPERVIILEFKDRLKHLRKEKNLTQIELASILHYGYTAIANYENGRNQPRINDLIRLANAFGVSLDYLVGISDVKYYMTQDTVLQENIAKKMYEKGMELTLMDKLIICFLYNTSKSSLNTKNFNLDQISKINKTLQNAEQECYIEFSKRFYIFLKDSSFRKIILEQIQNELKQHYLQ